MPGVNILGIQLLAILFGFFMLYVSFLHFRRGELPGGVWFFWTVLWLAFIVIALAPQLLDPIIVRLKIVRVMDLGMIVAFMILAYLGFENYVRNRRMEKKIEELTRKEALKDLPDL